MAISTHQHWWSMRGSPAIPWTGPMSRLLMLPPTYKLASSEKRSRLGLLYNNVVNRDGGALPREYEGLVDVSSSTGL